MEEQEYKEIAPELLEQAYHNARSIESMDESKKEDKPEYIGSQIKGNKVYDYYQDDSSDWWYRTRGIVDDQIISMDIYIFGKELNKSKSSKQKY